MYKSQLQEVCQKKSWALPVYKSVKDGPDHQPRFTATVTVNDATFESPTPCRNSKEAQNAAAQVAFDHFSSLPNAPQQPLISLVQKYASTGSSALTTNLDKESAKSGEVGQKRQDGPLLAEISTSIKEDLLHTYKNRLHIYAQKQNLTLPTYSSEIIGPPHERLFKCKVKVDGKSFETPNFFSTLKDAEHGAAKVAFESMSLRLTEEDNVLYKNLLHEHAQRKGLHIPIYDTQKSGPLHTPLFVSTVVIGDQSFQGQEAKSKKMAEMNAAKSAYICLTKYDNGKRHRNSTTSEDSHAREQGSSDKSPPQDSKDGACLPTLGIVIPPEQASVKRILVCPRTPDMIIPEGATVLPSSNDQWVAIARAVPEEEYEKYYN